MKQIHFISGLPRSGSTLLCQILNIHPEFIATPTSPMLDMLIAQQSVFSHNPGFKAVDRISYYNDFAEAQKAFLETYYKTSKIVFDKNRAWPMHLEKIDEVLEHEDSKVIWTYRDPIDVIASMEYQHRKYPLIQFPDEQTQAGLMATMDSRIAAWVGDSGLVNFPQRALRDAVQTGYAARIKIINYTDLCSDPQKVMDSIHEFLGLEKFQYDKNDWKDLKQSTLEYDHLYNYKYPHVIAEGAIQQAMHDTEYLEDYKPILKERFKWLNDYCAKEVVKESNRQQKRSERFKKNKAIKMHAK